MRVKTWKVLDRGTVPLDSPTIPFECLCGREAELPVVGRVVAITGEDGDSGIVFDPGIHAMPAKIQCRKCGRVLVS